MKVKKKRRKKVKQRGRKTGPYPFEFRRLKVARLRLEEGYGVSILPRNLVSVNIRYTAGRRRTVNAARRGCMTIPGRPDRAG